MAADPAKKKYMGLLIEPELERRNRLKTVTSAATVFERVEAIATLEDALTRLSAQNWDVVFISSQMSHDKVDDFIPLARQTKFGKLAAFIAIEKRNEQMESTVGSSVVRGVDGVLWEPYSVDSVIATTKIADQIKAADALLRKKAAVSMMVEDALSEVDNIGRALLSGQEDSYRASLKKLKDVGDNLKVFAKDSAPVYNEVFRSKVSQSVGQTLKVLRQRYGGVSERVQRMLDKKTGKKEETPS